MSNTSLAQAPIAEKVILVGNPNVGKSVVFGRLTGRYVNVSNYPGTTVEITRGEIRDRGRVIEIIDTPGVYSLHPMSEDERVTRDILMNEPGAKILQVCDAKNLRRSLMITAQLSEMRVPMAVVVNMVDEARERGVMPRIDSLGEDVGVPVLGIVAVRGKGTDRLTGLIAGASVSRVRIDYGEIIEAAISEMEPLIPEDAPIGRRALSLMLLSGDDSLAAWLRASVTEDRVRAMNEIRNRLVARVGDDVGYIVNQRRAQWTDRLVERLGIEPSERPAHGYAQRLGQWAMDPVYGIPVLLGVLLVAYGFVGAFGAGTLVDLLQNRLFGELVIPAVTRLADAVIPWEILRSFLVGPYGVISMALSYAVAIVLPIVGTFFFFFGILEDSGYLPRLAVMVDRLFKRIGCNGKAVLPLVLGLGCDTMATLTARILESRKERLIVTLLLALGIPCSAQLGVILGMLGGVGLHAALIWTAIVVGVIILVGWLAAKVIPGHSSDFIMEIPPIRMPQLGNLAVKTMARIEWYLREAVPLFVVGTVILFVADRTGALAFIERVSQPLIVRLLDLPPSTAGVFLIGFLRRDYGAAGLYRMAQAGLLDHVQVLVSLVTMTLFIPCLANFLVIIKEHGMKIAVGMAVFIFPFAILVGAALNYAIRHLGIVL
ncbi:MAG TPA: ferrous iron transport protein B [Candidatus Deferrimicrobiaceae bacterium]|jgi:ferrous iron transport protein B